MNNLRLMSRLKNRIPVNFFAKSCLVGALWSVALVPTVFANTNNGDIAAIGPKIGTQGIGIEARAGLFDSIYARMGANYFRLNHKFGGSDLRYNAKLTLMTVPLMIDYHPFADSGFRISIGAAYNGNKASATATPNKSVTLYGKTYQVSDIGRVNAKLKLGNKIAGIFAIGYDNSLIGSGSPFSFHTEIGVMYCGSPKLDISATGAIASRTNELEDFRRDANSRLNKVKKYLRVFPIASLGFKYSF